MKIEYRKYIRREVNIMEAKDVVVIVITWICVLLFYRVARKLTPYDTWFVYLYKYWVVLLGIIFTLYVIVSA